MRDCKTYFKKDFIEWFSKQEVPNKQTKYKDITVYDYAKRFEK